MKTRTNQPVFKDNGTLLKDSDLGDKLPEIAEGDAGKVLMVNSDEDGYELGTPSGTPFYVLSVKDLHILTSGGTFKTINIGDFILFEIPTPNDVYYLNGISSDGSAFRFNLDQYQIFVDEGDLQVLPEAGTGIIEISQAEIKLKDNEGTVLYSFTI